MSDFHYVRTLGSDGGVDACSGPAIGLDLESVLADGLPPFKVALQIIAGLCEILDIAEEDGEVHGNIEPKYVFIDDTGAISLEAFGQARSRAPEARPKGSSTDLYGLGYVAYRLFAFHPLPKLPNDDADAHDDAVIDAVLGIRFDGMNEDMIGDVQWFLAKLLSFEREERPAAVETWRTFLAFAEESQGPDFVQWCLDALDSGGERRGFEDAADTEPSHGLGGPLVSQGPLAAGGLNFGGGAPPASGTAFFTKDDMKAALEQGTNQRADQFRPSVGGGNASSYWNRDQLKAMAEDEAKAPRPKRAQGEGEKRKTMAFSKGDLQKQGGRARKVTGAYSASSVATARPPAPKPPAAPAPPKPNPSPQALSGDFGSSSFDQPEPTVRMDSKAVRTMTPAPAPQVFRPPGLGGSPPSTPPAKPPPADLPEIGTPEGSMLGEATVVQSTEEVEAALVAERARVNASLPPQPAPAGFEEPVHAPPPGHPQSYAPPHHHAPEESSANVWIIAGIAMILVVAMIACAGLGGISAFVAFVSGSSSSTTVEAAPIPIPTPTLPATRPDPEPVAANPTPKPGPSPTTGPTSRPTPRPTPRPGPRPTPRPSPSPSPSSSPSPSPAPRPAPAPTPRPAPAPAPEPATTIPDGPVTLTVKTMDRGRLNCPGVANKPFDGNISMNIENYALPATCVVTMEGTSEPAAFQVFNTGAVKCSKRGDAVSCTDTVVGR